MVNKIKGEKHIIKDNVYNHSYPINTNNLFQLKFFCKECLYTWEEIEKMVEKVWIDYAPDYPRLTGRYCESAKLKKIIPSTPYAVLMKDLMLVTKPFIKQEQHWIDLCSGKGRTIDFMLDIESTLKFDAIDRFTNLAPHLKDNINISYYNEDPFTYLNKQKENSVDGLISNMGWVYVMNHLTEDGKSYIGKIAAKKHLESINRVLKKDSPLIFSSPKRNVNFIKVFISAQPYIWLFWNWIPERNFRPWSGIKVLNHAMKLAKIGKTGLFHFYSEYEFKEILNETGFYNIKSIKSFANQDIIFSAQKK